MANLQAVEFFSGIGSFAEACRQLPIEIIAAFDQNTAANAVYEFNFELKPEIKNLDSIDARRLPDAHIWWLSPPCTPYSRRGKQSDLDDPRAKSLLHLIDILPIKRPRYFFLENVLGFAESNVRLRLIESLQKNGYSISEIDLCSTHFGVPMRRPRRFIIASTEPASCVVNEKPQDRYQILPSFLDQEFDPALLVSDADLERYGRGFNIVDEDDASAIAICFTKGYWRCKLASGSLIRTKSGAVRRFSPKEILRLFGFSDSFEFPPQCALPTIWQLLGNAVDIRAISHIINGVAYRHHLETSSNPKSRPEPFGS